MSSSQSRNPIAAPPRPRLGLLLGLLVAVVATAALLPLVGGTAGLPAAAAARCAAPTWSASAVYTAGNQVTYASRTYRAKWWTQNEVPGTTGQWGVWEDLGACGTTPTDPPTTTPPTTPPPTTPPPTTPPATGGKKVIGYFTNWGTYARNFHAKDLDTSGSAARLTHLLYAFGNVQNGRCTIGDSYADYDKAYTAAQSVDGVADTWDQPLRGNFNQLRKLKAKYPHLKIIWSFGGWTWSGGFTQAAQDPQAFAQSCRALVEDPRWADVFDGIDIDWEYPNACGLSCDASGTQAFPRLMQALRGAFGSDLVTAAITADGTSGGKIEKGGYGAAAQYVDWYMPMTYDYFGAFAAQGPTAPHSPLTSYAGIPTQGFDASTAIAKLKALGVPSSKLLLGLGFYGRGWSGVTQSAPGGSATGPAPGTYEQGIEDYEVLKQRCPATGTVGGTAYAKCGDQWWSYDTPATITSKMAWAKQQGLAGAFFWELSGDTPDGELIRAVSNGLAG